jgi:hypothetical protein
MFVGGKQNGQFINARIKVDNTEAFWAPSLGGSRGNRYSLRGTLIHEMGHSFGLGHAGNQAWNVKGAATESSVPSVTELNTPDRSEYRHDVEADDESGVLWVENAMGKDWWNPNAGFEAGGGCDHWTVHGTADCRSASAWMGSWHGFMPSKNDYFRISQLYDPWKGKATTLPSDGMVDDPAIVLRTHYYDSGNETGGVRIKYTMKQDFDYPTKETKNAPTNSGTWDDTQSLNTCNKSNQTWKLCKGTIYPDQDLAYDPNDAPYDVSNNALAVRVTFLNLSPNSANISIDNSGMDGW